MFLATRSLQDNFRMILYAITSCGNAHDSGIFLHKAAAERRCEIKNAAIKELYGSSVGLEYTVYEREVDESVG